MANIKKNFNFRNGVQVDDDNLLVTATGLVGIGTTIPNEALDVRGNVVITGFTSTTTAQIGVLTVTTTLPLTSRASFGMVVPIPTRPVSVTNRLSSSTCTPLRKLKFFLIFAISYIFSYLFDSSDLTLAESSLTASIKTGTSLS